MKRIFLTLSALALSAIMALAQQPTREQMEAYFAQMPQLPNTDQVRIGHLDNGLTYYIRHNELPKGRAEFYLATNVGAIQEIQPEQDAASAQSSAATSMLPPALRRRSTCSTTSR